MSACASGLRISWDKCNGIQRSEVEWSSLVWCTPIYSAVIWMDHTHHCSASHLMKSIPCYYLQSLFTYFFVYCVCMSLEACKYTSDGRRCWKRASKNRFVCLHSCYVTSLIKLLCRRVDKQYSCQHLECSVTVLYTESDLHMGKLGVNLCLATCFQTTFFAPCTYFFRVSTPEICPVDDIACTFVCIRSFLCFRVIAPVYIYFWY